MTIRKRGEFYSSEFWEQGVFYAFTFNGKFSKKYNRKMPVKTKLKDARDMEAELRKQIRSGEFDTEPGLEDFCTFVDTVYLQYAKDYKASAKSDESQCKVLKEYFKDKKFNEITTLLVEKFIKETLQSTTQRKEKLEDGTIKHRLISSSTVNKYVKLLSMICDMAIQESGTGLKINPCASIRPNVRKTLSVRKKRERFLSYEEEERLLAEFKGKRAYLRSLVILAIETGMRRGELLKLKWDYVNLSSLPKTLICADGEVVTIETASIYLPKEITKTGRARGIPLTERAKSILIELNESEVKGEFVLLNNRTELRLTDVKKGFRSAVIAAGIPHGIYKPNGFTFHDLRHTCATRLAASGASPYVIRDILGHATIRMTDNYTHSSGFDRKEAMAALESSNGRKKEGSGKILAMAQ